MIEESKVDQFLMHWRSINRHLREGRLTNGDKNITRLQWTLLRYVGRSENCTMGSIANHFNVGMSTVSQMIDRLEKWGYVERGVSIRDARVKMVSLTEKGTAIIQEVRASYLEQLTHGLNRFSEDERETFLRYFQRLAENLRELSSDEQSVDE